MENALIHVNRIVTSGREKKFVPYLSSRILIKANGLIDQIELHLVFFNIDWHVCMKDCIDFDNGDTCKFFYLAT